MLNKKIFMECFIGMCEVYDKEFSEYSIKLYFETVKDIEDTEFKNAVIHLLRNRVFSTFPKPAEFRELVFGKKNENEKIKIQEALASFKKAIAYAGSVKFEDKTIHKTIKLMGGWSFILRTRQDNLHWKYKEFEEIYASLINDRKGIEYEEELYNHRDKVNIENGLSVMPVKIFGSDVVLALEKNKESD